MARSRVRSKPKAYGSIRCSPHPFGVGVFSLPPYTWAAVVAHNARPPYGRKTCGSFCFCVCWRHGEWNRGTMPGWCAMWTPNSEPPRGRPQVAEWQPNGAAICGRIWSTTREGVGFQFRGGSLADHLSAYGGGRKAVMDFHLNACGGGTWAANSPYLALHIGRGWTSDVEGGGRR